MKKIVFLFGISLLCVSALFAENRVVDPENGPYKNLQDAFADVKSGEAILISPGTYYIDDPLVLNGLNDVAINSTIGPVDIVSTDVYADILVLENCSGITLYGITLYHEIPEGCAGYVLVMTGCSDVSVMYCTLSGSGAVGAYLERCSVVALESNSIYDNSWAGVVVTEGNESVYIGYNDFAGNYQDVLVEGEELSWFEGTTGPVTMQSNIFGYFDEEYGEGGIYGYRYFAEDTMDDYYFSDVDFTAFYDDEEPYSGKIITVGVRGSQYQSIQEAVNAAGSGDTIRIRPGEYVVNDTVRVSGKKDLTIEGVNEVSIVLTVPYDHVLSLEQSGSVTLRNIMARHAETGACGASVVNIFHVRNVLVENCELNGSGQVGVNLMGRCDELTVRNCYIHDNSSYAGCLYLYSGVLNFEGNVVENNGGPLEIHDDDFYFTIFGNEDVNLLDSELGLAERGFYFYNNDFYSNDGSYDGYGGYEDYEYPEGAAQ